MNDDLAFAPLPVLGARLRGGEFSCVELTKFFLDRLETHGPRYNCLVTLTRELALEQAAQADRELKEGRDRGPLHGIPYGAKDLLAARGYPTSWGAAPYRSRVLDKDATVITKLREAGAVLVAKLSLVELAGGMGYKQAHASLTGPGLNPWDTSRWSGGSSSGSGSAVAAGLVPFAIGSETIGSINSPSSQCGITGLRPTYGRVSRAGAMALSWTLDKIGPMAHTAFDCGTILEAIAGPDPNDPSAFDRSFRWRPIVRSGRPFKLAILKDGVKDAQREVREHFERALDVFRGFATIEEVTGPDLPAGPVATTILGAEKAAAFEEMLDSGQVFELTAPEDKIGGFASQTILATEYLRAQRIRARICREYDAWLAPFDAVLTAGRSGTAGKISEGLGKPFRSASLLVEGNLCGTPALTLPIGLDAEGLPTALQIDGRAYAEDVVLSLGAAFQQATGWHELHPRKKEIKPSS
jgi:aspartyl-tRNA(Asn)/glutamyl-tRNA(Gln) amidotransferase subunit A